MQVCDFVCVCALSQAGVDRQAGKQAGSALISPVAADGATPARLLQQNVVCM